MTDSAPVPFGRYQLLDRIATGAMAEVFRAKSYGVEGFEKVVVVKRMHPALANDQTFVDAYLREARMSVGLSHAHVVQVLDLGREADTYFVAQELVLGHSLEEVIRKALRRGVKLPVELAIFVGCGIARALDYAHRRKDPHGQPLKVVHRDVTPRSVMLSNEGEVKLADFGIATARRYLEQAGALQPRVAYMAPETLRDEAVDAKTDLYGLGVTLYTALAGRDPFTHAGPQGTKTEAVRQRVLAGEATPLATLRDDVPDTFVAVIERAMARDPADRWPSAAHVFEELTGLLYAAQRRVGSNDLGTWIRGFQHLPSLQPPADIDVPEAVEIDDEVEIEALDDIEVDTEEPLLTDDRPSVQDIVIDEPLLAEPEVSVEDEVAIDIDVPLMVEAPEAPIVMAVTEVTPDPSLAGPWGERRPLVTVAFRALPATGATLLTRHGAALLRDEHGAQVWVFGTPVPTADDAERAASLVMGLGAQGASLAVLSLAVDADGHCAPDARYAPEIAALLDGLPVGAVVLDEGIARALEDRFEVLRDGPVLALSGQRKEARLKVAGRKDPFRLVAEQLSRTATGGTRVVTLRGEEGIGKTRFLDEVGYRLRRMNHPVDWHLVTCEPAMAPRALSGLQSLLRTLLKIEDTDADTVVRDKARRVRELGLTPEEMLSLGAVLGVVSGLTDGPSAGTRPLRVAIQKIVSRLAGDKVAVIAFDAAEHLDPATAAVLDEMVMAASHEKLLLVFAAQPGRRFLWEERDHLHTAVTLGPLTSDEARQLVGLRLGVTEVPNDLVTALCHETDGYPRGLVEALREALHAGVVRVEGTKVEADLALIAPSQSHLIAAGVLGRIARFPSETRRLLHAASVVGPRFAHEQAAGLAALDESFALRTLDGLVSESYLTREESSGAYSFSLSARPKVLERALDPEVRLRLRARIALVSEARLGERMDAFADTVAEHLVEAGDEARAVAFLSRAAERQRAHGMTDRAIGSLVRAIELAENAQSDGDAAVLPRYLRLAEFADDASELEPVLDALRRGVSLAEAQNEGASVEVLLLALGHLLLRHGDGVEAVKVFERAGQLADRRSDRAHKALSALGVAMVYAERGEYGRATRALLPLESSLQHTTGAPLARVRWLCALARCRAASAEFERATECLQALASMRATLAGHRALRAAVERVRAEVLLAAGDTTGAANGAIGALLAARDDDRAGLAAAATLAGITSWRQGDSAQAEARFREAYEAAASRSMVRFTARTAAWLAFLAGSRQALDNALAAVEAHGFTGDALECKALSGRLSVQLGEHERARRELREAKMKAGATDNRVLAEVCDVALRAASPSVAPRM